MQTKFQYNDGGRAAASYKGSTGDCATRAIAIVTGLPYKQVYNMINETAKSEKSIKGSDITWNQRGKGWRSVKTALFKAGLCIGDILYKEKPEVFNESETYSEAINSL